MAKNDGKVSTIQSSGEQPPTGAAAQAMPAVQAYIVAIPLMMQVRKLIRKNCSIDDGEDILGQLEACQVSEVTITMPPASKDD